MVEREEFYIRSKDKHTRLHGYLWRPEGEAVAALQLSHGMMEHIGRYDRFAVWLAQRGVAVIGHDHLGHGRTGNVEDLSFFSEEKGAVFLVRDLFQITKRLKQEYPDTPHFLLGHSMGSFISRRYLTIYGRHLDGVIFMGTGFTPLWMAATGKLSALLAGAVKGKHYQSDRMQELVLGSFNRAFRPNRTSCDWLSREETEVDAFLKDPYCNIPFSCGAYVELFNLLLDLALKRQYADIPKALPVLFLSGEQDPVGDFGKGVKRVYRQFCALGLSDVSIKLYPEARHELLNESNREEVFEDIWKWLKRSI